MKISWALFECDYIVNLFLRKVKVFVKTCHLNLKSRQFLFNLNLKSRHLKWCSLGPKTEVQSYDSGAQKIYQ